MKNWFTHYRARRLEWSLSIFSALFGLVLVLPHTSMATTEYSPVLSVLGERGWGAIYATAGLCHMMALHVNGRGAWTPFARLAALFINSQVLLTMSLAFAQGNVLGTATITYGSLAVIFCGPAIWSAALDCGNEIAIWRGKNGD